MYHSVKRFLNPVARTSDFSAYIRKLRACAVRHFLLGYDSRAYALLNAAVYFKAVKITVKRTLMSVIIFFQPVRTLQHSRRIKQLAHRKYASRLKAANYSANLRNLRNRCAAVFAGHNIRRVGVGKAFSHLFKARLREKRPRRRLCAVVYRPLRKHIRNFIKFQSFKYFFFHKILRSAAPRAAYVKASFKGFRTFRRTFPCKPFLLIQHK